MAGKGKRLTHLTISLGVVVLVASGFALKRPILEQWYIWKLESKDESDFESAANKLAEMKSVRALEVLIKKLKDENLRIRNSAASALEGIKNLDPLSPEDVALLYLKHKAVGDPVSVLIKDLQRQKDLIPHKGILGGTMAFHFPERIHLLGRKRVLAYFEDGHISGLVLLKYDLSSNGEITWTVLSSFLT